MGSSRICWPELMDAACEAATHAVVHGAAPQVGCAILADGHIYQGATLEHLFAHGNMGTCAERSALARLLYDCGRYKKATAVAIFNQRPEKPSAPCGICRAALHAAALPGLLVRSASPGEPENGCASFTERPSIRYREWRIEALYPISGRIDAAWNNDVDPRDTTLEWERLSKENHPGVVPLTKDEEALIDRIDPKANTLRINDVPLKYEHGHLPSVLAGDRRPAWAALVFQGRPNPIIGYEAVDATTRLSVGPVHSAVQQVLSTGNARKKGRRLKFVLVYSPTPYLPVMPGADRQILYELTARTPQENTNRKVPIILTCASGYTVKTSLDFLLPEPFGPDALGY